MEQKINSGIYVIKNLINNKVYIGSSKNLTRRKNRHFLELKKQIHHNNYLQNSYNKYGKTAFVFHILEYVEYVEDVKDLINCKQWWIDMCNPEYNICKTAGSFFGLKHKEETIKKLIESNKKRKDNGFRGSRFGSINSSVHRERISKSKKRPILQLDKTSGIIIRRWNSAKDAAETLGLHASNISKVCNGDKYACSCGGYKWMYEV